jgi:hypothetical protein
MNRGGGSPGRSVAQRCGRRWVGGVDAEWMRLAEGRTDRGKTDFIGDRSVLSYRKMIGMPSTATWQHATRA